jgi:putative component of membrane protein insertase Oxa1/YidC/SpoIIIJ protein YidD
MRFSLFLIAIVMTMDLTARPGYFEPWGKDADLLSSSLPAQDTSSPSLFVRLTEQIILFHQRVLSPVDGPRSHYLPSSSQYMKIALRKHGFLKGFCMGCDRLMRENSAPWVYQTTECDGQIIKYDPVP